MKNIGYNFVRTSPLSYGQLSQEKNANGTVVNTLTISGSTRTEARPDGASRTFTYGATLGTGGATKNYLLKSYTDFAAHTTTLSYDADGFVNSINDFNGRITSITRLNLGYPTGVISKITHPTTATENPGATIQYFYTDGTGAYLDHVIDERGKQTTYKRNTGTLTTYEIDYPDGGIELYDYNTLGQVWHHTMPSNTATGGSGGIETFAHDTTGLLTSYTPPATTSDGNPGAHPTQYAYDINDHLLTVTDPRGSVTTYYHNEIGQVTYALTSAPDASTVANVYNADGTLQYQSVSLTSSTSADTNYTYDDYKRILTETDPLGKITKFWYDKAGTGVADLTHTDANVTRLVLPSLKS